MTVRVQTASGMPLRQPPPPPPGRRSGGPANQRTGGRGSNIPTRGDREIAGGAKHIAQRGPGAGVGESGLKADASIGGDLDNLIKKNLMARVQGKNPKFSEEIMGHMKEKLFKETQGQTRRARMALMADAARRGVFRSEATGGLVADIEIAGIQAYSSGVKDLLVQKAIMDHDDMIKAIDSSQRWLASTRQYQLGLERNAIGREQIKATMAAASMAAAASRYGADQGLKGARAGASAYRWAAQQRELNNRQINTDSEGNVSWPRGPDGKPMSMAQHHNMRPGGGGP